jgi:hypothetical protein
VRGVIDRRILVNYRVQPEVLARLLPAPFQPKLLGDWAMGGICLIRLRNIRPRFLPPVIGIRSENAAHRMAVQWERDGRQEQGVYVTRRDSSSRLNALIGGRLFPGVHHHARFVVEERDDFYRVQMDSDDGQTHIAVEGRPTRQLPAGSVFGSLQRASDFFEQGSVGYSASYTRGEFDGLKLDIRDWKVVPLDVERLESSFFDDRSRFPTGSVEFDCALLMLGIEHQWCEQPMMCCEAAAV